MYAWQFARYLGIAERMGMTRFVAMESHYNLIYREEEREMFPLCRFEGVATMPWSPFARGFLAGNRRGGAQGETLRSQTDAYGRNIYYANDDYRPDDYQILEAVTKVAQQKGVTNAQVALGWVLQQPGVTSPIIGATKISQLDDTAKAMAMKFDDEELKALTAPYQPHPVTSHS